jgi:hypothetical protein
VNLFDELRDVLRALDQAKVEYALAGGLAVAVWGAPRATKDIDLLVLPQALADARAAVRSCGFVLEALPIEFKDGMTLHRMSKVDQQGSVMTVDLMLAEGSLQPVWAGRVRLPFADAQVSVVSRESLIAMKAAAARPQDLADIANLHEVDR